MEAQQATVYKGKHFLFHLNEYMLKQNLEPLLTTNNTKTYKNLQCLTINLLMTIQHSDALLRRHMVEQLRDQLLFDTTTW